MGSNSGVFSSSIENQKELMINEKGSNSDILIKKNSNMKKIDKEGGHLHDEQLRKQPLK